MRFLLSLLLGLGLLHGCAPTTAPSASTGNVPPGAGELRVTFLDVGQGDSALIRTPDGDALLIDGGPSNAGDEVVAALREAGVNRLRLLVGSHPHEDHIGGLAEVLRTVPVEQALDPGYAHGTATQRNYLQLLREREVKTTRARSGQVVDLGENVRLEILAPSEPLLKGTESDANNNSIVARLTYGDTAFLFTGDMENAERARLLRSASSNQLRADVLKVAHHGSHNGTDPDFLRAVRPRYSVISLARDNDYGHPHREALEALRNSGTRILRTDEQGSITFTSNGRQVTLRDDPGSAAVAEPAPAPAPATTGQVIGNRTSKVYHTPDCPRLPGPDNQIKLPDAASAEAQGYRPHAACIRASGATP